MSVKMNVKNQIFLVFSWIIIPFALYSSENNPYPSLTQNQDLIYNLGNRDLLLLDIDQTLLDTSIVGHEDKAPLMEKETLNTLKALQAKGVIILAFTARNPSLAKDTEQQLKYIDLDFSKNIQIQMIKSEYFKEASLNATFQKGILYAKPPYKTSSVKGPALNKFLSFFMLPPAVQQQYSTPSVEPSTRILDPKKIKRIVLLDDMKENLESLQASLSQSDFKEISLLTYHFKPQDKANFLAPSNPSQKIYEYISNTTRSFPSSIKDFKYIKTLVGGTGGVHVLQDSDGTQYTLKCPGGDLDHFKEEVIADVFIKVLGGTAPDIAIYNEKPLDPLITEKKCPNSGFYRLAQFIESDSNESDLEKAKIIEQLQERFLVDAFLSNWDVVESGGNKYKNVILSKEGKLYSIDHGGSLRYRSLGELKKAGEGWEPLKVTELKTMRDPNYSFQGAKVYGPLTPQQLSRQAKKLMDNYPNMIKTLSLLNEKIQISNIESLQKMLAGRVQYLHDIYLKDDKQLPLSQSSLAHKFDPAIPDETAAGIFIYAYVNQEAYTLLGQRIRHKWYGNLGGKSDPGEDILPISAARETQEESMGLISILPEELNHSPSHDLITDTSHFRMYFSPYNYIEASILNNALKNPPSNYEEVEYTEFVWAKVNDLLECVKKGQTQTEEKTPTTSCPAYSDPQNLSTKKDVILHPPLFKMLRQRPVLRAMEEISAKSPLKPLHTRGKAETSFPPITLPAAPDQYNTEWETVSPADKTQETPSVVPFGQDATGRIERDRVLKTSEGSANEKIWYDAAKEKKQLNRSILAHAQAMGEIKGKVQNGSFPAAPSLNASQDFLSPNNEILRQQLEATPYTQSEADLKLLMEDKYQEVTNENYKEKIPQNIFNLLTKYSTQSIIFSNIKTATDPFILTLSQVWEVERTQKDKVFAYHGTDALTGLLYDVFTEFRRQLLIAGGEGMLVPRALDKAFERIFTVDEFIREQMHKQSAEYKKDIPFEELDNYSGDFKEKALSANLFLFGNDKDISSSTVRYFYESRSLKPPNYTKLLKEISASLGVNINFEDLKELLSSLKLEKEGRLFQFIFEPEVAQNLVYTASNGGTGLLLPLLDDTEKTYNPVKVVSLLRKDPGLYQKYLTDRKVNTIQLRMLAHPQQLQNPTLTHVKTYWVNMLNQEQIELYKNKIKSYVQQLILQLLQNQKRLPPNAFIQADQASDKMAPLQRLTKYAQEGSTGKAYTLDKQQISLPDVLYQGDVKLLQSVLSTQPNLKIETKVSFKNAAGEEIIFNPFENAIEKNNSEFIKFLLENHQLTDFNSIDPSLLIKGLIINNDLEIFKDFLNRIPSLRTFVQFSFVRGKRGGKMLEFYKELLELDFDLIENISASKMEETRINLKQGADIGAATLQKSIKLNIPLKNYSLLLIPLSKRDTSMFKFLLDLNDPNINLFMKDLQNKSLLEIAIEQGQKEIADLLIKKVPSFLQDFLGINKDDNNLFHSDIDEGNKKIVEFLLDYVPELFFKKDIYGNTSLHIAIRDGHLEIAQLLFIKIPKLLEEPYVKNIFNNTPLHIAVKEGHVEMVKFFKKNAPQLFNEPYIRNGSNQTLTDLAQKTKNKEIIDLLNNNSSDIK